ncbi:MULTISPECIES: DUF4012 domain-containing protein [unclassified Curtobacterium]|uniref:DUF4012 domain-containing protein n=1 Tax=unclassified Curtobacterium TaxID=257496 RepID=UPI000F4A65A7|nr:MULTISPECIES: DUF4012 domain-containing protein [unclassified Curtobacterium]ROQ17632.1 uncharacterized protein DUF4012 [Curtobacterium sp. PhB171]ROQ29123.1 uncharacterized protein DUF4012 [Curtobacterium sp. PhB170]ROS45733.1 uncharacterized protein DUF4012 [Curtobacterium sp. PhB131]ROS67965.1 uncharacterized protein DUF4012 [Curtobacterium sp. PhB141]
MSDASESRRAARTRGPRRRWLLWGVLFIVLLVIAAVAWVTIRGVQAKQDLESSVAHVDTLRSQLAKGDTAAAQRTAVQLESSAADARAKTSDPVWAVFEHTPFIGGNLRAVRQVSAIVDDVASDAVRPVAGVLGDVDVDAFKPEGGKIDLQPLVAAQPAVAKATTALSKATRAADRIDTGDTVSAVTDAVNQLRASLASVSEQAAVADKVVQLAPAMLGEGGAKQYLVLFQNNAELRAGGGIPGAVALLDVRDGAISLGQQASTSDFPQTDDPVLPLTTETQGLYGSITGEFIQDVTLTPRFDTSAKLAREMWKQQFGQRVDGVLSIDPVTLGYILKATGPVTLATGDQLTSDNAVQLLLSEAYAKYPDPTVQDAFFASAASAVFTKVSEGGFDPKEFVAALTTGVDEGRVKLWSADKSEQSELTGTAIAGGLPTSDTSSQQFGVYLNDATGAKMDYYLKKTVSVGSEVCRKDGRPTWTVEVTLKSTAPADAATSLPEYVTGAGAFGVAPGAVRTNVAVYAPSSGVYVTSTQDGKTASPQTATDGVHPVAQFQTTLSPGKSTTIRVQYLGGVDQGRTAVDAVSTPGVHQSVTKPLASSCESPVD